MRLMVEISVSILCSLIASLIVAIVSRLYKYHSKHSIRKKLEYVQSCLFVFEHAVGCNDYPTALSQADLISQTILSIYDDIYPFTFYQKKRKLFKTYLYHVYYLMLLSKEYELTTGVPHENMEIQCRKIQHYLSFGVCEHGMSSAMSAVTFLKSLANTITIRQAFENYYKHDNFNDIIRIIHPDWLSYEYSSTFRKENLSEKEFKMIASKFNSKYHTTL